MSLSRVLILQQSFTSGQKSSLTSRRAHYLLFRQSCGVLCCFSVRQQEKLLTPSSSFIIFFSSMFLLICKTHIFIQTCACFAFDYFNNKSAIYLASMSSVPAADDNGCQDLTLPLRRVGRPGEALDNTERACLT